jgi:hypothetical protein
MSDSHLGMSQLESRGPVNGLAVLQNHFPHSKRFCCTAKPFPGQQTALLHSNQIWVDFALLKYQTYPKFIDYKRATNHFGGCTCEEPASVR